MHEWENIRRTRLGISFDHLHVQAVATLVEIYKTEKLCGNKLQEIIKFPFSFRLWSDQIIHKFYVR